jgi:hypothetical protein
MRRLAAPATLALVLLFAGGAAAVTRPLPVEVRAHTGLRLTGIVWTGSRLLYVENTTNVLWAPGNPPTQFAQMPKVVEETRCVASPAAHGWPSDSIFCHSPDNIVYRVQSNGTVTTFAKLSDPLISDGALAFDTIGTFGYRLLTATGGSGSGEKGGTVYAVTPAGDVSSLGTYASPKGGGADEIIQAPPGFGSIAGQLVMTIDAESHGAIVAFDPKGGNRVLAYLPDGPNPISVVPKAPATAKPHVSRGLYLTDTLSTDVYRVPESALRAYAGDLIVGTELKAQFWVVAPKGNGFTTTRIPLKLPGGPKFNLEASAFVP